MDTLERIELNTALAMRQNHMMASNGKDDCRCRYCTLARATIHLTKQNIMVEKRAKPDYKE